MPFPDFDDEPFFYGFCFGCSVIKLSRPLCPGAVMDLDIIIAKVVQDHEELTSQHIGVAGGDDLLAGGGAHTGTGQDPGESFI